MAKAFLKNAINEALRQAPKSPQDKKSADLFAKEMHYQCFRIQNVLQWQSSDVLKKYMKSGTDFGNLPVMHKFFESYKNKNVKQFIENAKNKTLAEREKLLDGLRKVIHKAKIEKVKNVKSAKKEKPQETNLDRILKKKLNEQDLNNIESKISVPFVTEGKKLDLRKVQSYYGTVVMGQRALGTYVDQFQKNYNASMKKLKSHQKKYKDGWRSYAGVADWGYRKVGSLWGGVKSVFGAKSKKTGVEKINLKIKKARKICKEKLTRVKAIRNNLAARTKELTDGLSGYKGDLRNKLKELIAKGDWAKAEQKRKQGKKQLLIAKKKELTEAWYKAKQNSREVDEARKQSGAVHGALGVRLKKVRSGEMILNGRAKEVSKRIIQMSRVYGEKDPRVVYMKQHVLLPLLRGSDRLKQIKEGTANKLTQVEDKNQRLDILKADMYTGATVAAAEISKLELGVKIIDSRIELVKKKRIELHKLLENVETAYVAIDQFKISTEKNFGTLNKNNTKAVTALDKQYNYLKKAKASTPGLGSSIWNTVGLGQWGALGAMTLPNRVPRYAGFAGTKLSGWIFGTKNYSFESTENWTLTGGLRSLQGGFDKWLDKDGFKQYQNKKTHWALKGVSTAGNYAAGIGNTVLSLVTGVGMIVFEPHIVVDALGNIATDWKVFKKTLGSLIHYKDWDEGRYSIAAGRSAGDIALLILTAGTSAGAQAGAKGAAAASKVGMAARVATRVGAVAKGTGRFAVNAPGKVVGLAKAIPFAVGRGIGTVGGAMWTLTRGGAKGLREFMLDTRLGRIVALRTKEFGKAVNQLTDGQLKNLSPETQKLLEKAFPKPEAGAKALDLKTWKIPLTDAEFAKLSKHLSREFYAGGWGVRQTIEPIAKRMQAYMRAKVKHDAGIAKLKVEGILPARTINYAKTKPPIKVPSGKGKYRPEAGQLELNFGKSYVHPRPIKIKATSRPTPQARALRSQQLEFDFAAKTVADGAEQAARTTVRQRLTKVMQTPKAKLEGRALATLKALITLPYWLPKRFYTKYLMMGEETAAAAVKKIMGNKYTFDMATHYNGVLQISKQINRELLKGRLGNAMQLYHGARVLGHKAGISYAIMDRSFLGYIHRVMPLSVNYIGRISMLHKPVAELKLPPFMKPKMEAMRKIQKEHATLVRDTKTVQQHKKIAKPTITTEATRYLNSAKNSLVQAGETAGSQSKKYLKTAEAQVERALAKAREEATSANAKQYLNSAKILLKEAGSEINSTGKKGAKRAKQYLQSARSAILKALNL